MKSTIIKERPILLSRAWVLALLLGRKTETRRVWNPKRRLADGEPSCPYGAIGDRLWVRETWKSVLPGEPLYRDDILYRADFAPEEAGPWKSSRYMPRWASRILLRITGVRLESLQLITVEGVVAEGLRAQRGDGTGPGAGYKWHGLAYESPVNPGHFHTPDRNGTCSCYALSPVTRQRYDLLLPPAICAWREGWDAINALRGHCWDANPSVWVVSFKVESIRSKP